MRLQPAIALDDYEEERMSGFGDRERRQARRAARKERREQRREGRREHKVERKRERIARKRDKVRQRLVPARRPMPALQPASAAMAPTRATPVHAVDRGLDLVDELIDDQDESYDDEGEDEWTEGIGAVSAWGPAVPIGRRLRIQAAAGHRAAVIELKPGLFLVADLPDAVTRTRFGFLPLLAPLMMTAARRSIDQPAEERRGPFRQLFRRRPREEVVPYVQVQPAAAPPAIPAPAEVEETAMVPAPNVGWADDATVAAVYGCDTCDRRGAR